MQLTVYRRDNRKKDHRRWRRRLLQVGAVLGAVVLAAAIYRLSGPFGIAAAFLYDFVLDNAYFLVREVHVHGGEKVSGSEIVAIAGLHRGMSIWKVDLAAIEKRIATRPWVRRVLGRREVPLRIVMDVEERVPKAIVAIRKLYYVDGDGLVFKEIGPGENVKFLLLTGLGDAGV